MPVSHLNALLDHLRKTGVVGQAGDLSDGQLLQSFNSQRSNAAFEALVRRHGSMVWGVCRRLLQNHHDAEDAFQATFLVLARKAASIVPREMVGNWLYGVARQTALRAGATAVKRRTQERQVMQLPEPPASDRTAALDMHEMLDEELSRLPDKYRVAVVLCDLEGKTRAEAARQLNWREGTVASRVARGRSLLAKRMARRGFKFSVATLAASLAPSANAQAPASLVSAVIKSSAAATTQAAACLASAKVLALAEGVIKTMLLSKLSKLSAVLIIAVACCGIGYVGYVNIANGQPAAEEPAAAEQASQFTKNVQIGGPAQTENAAEDPKDALATKEQIALWRKLRDESQRTLQELMQARALAADQAHKARLRKFVAGQVTANNILTSSQRLQSAESALGLTGEKRLEQLERQWGYAKIAYECYKPKFDGGKIGPDEYYAIQEYLLEMEIAVAKAKSQKGTEKK
ncbi:MAG: RNA polymerase sigma factor [Planctomycetes bacterium]|nr:RNA polymerase sigma factor [Planctomycetota bacterium]